MSQVKSHLHTNSTTTKSKKNASLKAKQLSVTQQVIVLKIDKTLTGHNSISDKTASLRDTFANSTI